METTVDVAFTLFPRNLLANEGRRLCDMKLLLPALTIVLLGSCVLALGHSEPAGHVELNQETDGTYKTFNVDVDAVLNKLAMQSIDDKPDALSVVNKKRGLQDTKSSIVPRREKRSTSSKLLNVDADECNAKPHPLSDIDKQKLLIEVLNAGPSAHDGLLDKELFSFENHHGCVTSRQASSASCDSDDNVKVLQVDADGKELVNENVHFENNRPKTVEVETEDRIVVHNLGSPLAPSEDRGAGSKSQPEQSNDAYLLKVQDTSQQGNETTQQHDDVKPGNIRPLKLDAWVNPPSSLRKSVKGSLTDSKKEGDVHLEVQPQPRQGVHPMANDISDTPRVKSVSAVEWSPSNPLLVDTSGNLIQYRIAPSSVANLLRRSTNNLLSSSLAKNLMLFPDVTSLKAAPVEGDPAKRADAGDIVMLIVVQPEVIPASLPEPGPMVLLPESVIADRRYVLVPAEDLLVAAPEASKDREAAQLKKEAEINENKYAYAKTNRRPEHVDIFNEKPVYCGSSKKAVQEKSSTQERLESKYHDEDATRDIFNVDAPGSVGTCCGPDCHCTCNLGPERKSAAAALSPSTGSRRNFVAGSKALDRMLESPSGSSQERRWPARKLTGVKSRFGKDVSRMEPAMRNSLDGHPYLKGMQIKRGDSAVPQRVVASTSNAKGDSGRMPIKSQFDGNLRRMAPFVGRRPKTHELSAGAWDVYHEIFGPRYKRDEEEKDKSSHIK